MNLSQDLDREYWRIVLGVMRRLEREAEVAKIETTVMCGDLLATTNRRLGQTRRQAVARVQRHRLQYALPLPNLRGWLRRG